MVSSFWVPCHGESTLSTLSWWVHSEYPLSWWVQSEHLSWWVHFEYPVEVSPLWAPYHGEFTLSTHCHGEFTLSTVMVSSLWAPNVIVSSLWAPTVMVNFRWAPCHGKFTLNAHCLGEFHLSTLSWWAHFKHPMLLWVLLSNVCEFALSTRSWRAQFEHPMSRWVPSEHPVMVSSLWALCHGEFTLSTLCHGEFTLSTLCHGEFDLSTLSWWVHFEHSVMVSSLWAPCHCEFTLSTLCHGEFDLTPSWWVQFSTVMWVHFEYPPSWWAHFKHSVMLSSLWAPSVIVSSLSLAGQVRIRLKMFSWPRITNLSEIIPDVSENRRKCLIIMRSFDALCDRMDTLLCTVYCIHLNTMRSFDGRCEATVTLLCTGHCTRGKWQTALQPESSSPWSVTNEHNSVESLRTLPNVYKQVSINGTKGTKGYKQTPWPLVRKRTIPTERPPLVGEI
jgi:hypothetical protein